MSTNKQAFSIESIKDKVLANELTRRGFIKVSSGAVAGMVMLQAATAFGAEAPLILMDKSKGIIIGDPTLCVGCQRCELACTEFNDGKASPALARIKIGRNINFGPDGVNGRNMLGTMGNALVIQDTCKQCPHPVPCATACPQNAIIADAKTGARTVNAEKCVGCKLCQTACPWGMMVFDKEKNKADKCFLCNGKPKCVAACPSEALRYVPWRNLTKSSPPNRAVMTVTPADKAAACFRCHK